MVASKVTFTLVGSITGGSILRQPLSGAVRTLCLARIGAGAFRIAVRSIHPITDCIRTDRHRPIRW